MSNPKTRQELYERIRETSSDEVILEEMSRLGYWPSNVELPHGPEAEIRRLGSLTREVNSIRSELSRLENQEAMLKAMRKKRMLESRQRRAETKKRREENRINRANAWQEAKAKDIIYLGEDISYGLRNQQGQTERLVQYTLPRLYTAADIAGAMKIEIAELRFLAFSRAVSRTTHYKRFYIPKKTGGERLISAPMPRLKEAQAWILENILEKIPVHEAAHGFCRGHSIVTNAVPHIKKDVVVNLDLKDFFPTITYKRVKGLFGSLGYSEQAATIFGLLSTESDTDAVELDNQVYYVTRGERYLPQGAPSSPMVTNLICRRLDKRLLKLAEILGFTYTRYADDITFSGSGEACDRVGKLLSKTRGIVEHEGFHIHPDKTRVLRKGRKQEVTGIVVNDGMSVDRKMLRKLRATLYQLEKDGIEGKHWGHCGDVLASVQGYAYFVYMVDPVKGAVLLERIGKIKEKLEYQFPQYKHYPKRTPSWKSHKDGGLNQEQEEKTPPTVPQESAGQKEKSQKPWWKFW